MPPPHQGSEWCRIWEEARAVAWARRQGGLFDVTSLIPRALAPGDHLRWTTDAAPPCEP